MIDYEREYVQTDIYPGHALVDESEYCPEDIPECFDDPDYVEFYSVFPVIEELLGRSDDGYEPYTDEEFELAEECFGEWAVAAYLRYVY